MACPICERPRNGGLLCHECSEAYRRSAVRMSGALYDDMAWAAGRARRMERRRWWTYLGRVLRFGGQDAVRRVLRLVGERRGPAG